MNGDIVTKSAVSVTEMARMVGLSRARFYQLVKAGTFPAPEVEPNTGRPFYSEDKQRTCLEVRRRNCGIDGKPILFYSRRRDFGQTSQVQLTGRHKTKQPGAQSKPKATSQYADLIDGLAALNVTATAAQVEQVVKELYPTGTAGIDQGEVLKAVFLRLRRQDSGGSEGKK
jgi:hypothetical protein